MKLSSQGMRGLRRPLGKKALKSAIAVVLVSSVCLVIVTYLDLETRHVQLLNFCASVGGDKWLDCPAKQKERKGVEGTKETGGSLSSTDDPYNYTEDTGVRKPFRDQDPSVDQETETQSNIGITDGVKASTKNVPSSEKKFNDSRIVTDEPADYATERASEANSSKGQWARSNGDRKHENDDKSSKTDIEELANNIPHRRTVNHPQQYKKDEVHTLRPTWVSQVSNFQFLYCFHFFQYIQYK